MVFGDYPEDRVFPIEDTNINQVIGEGLSTVEFIYAVSDAKIVFVEAKASTPQESTDSDRFEEFIDEIGKKFEHSFQILISTCLGRQPVQLPEAMQRIDFSKAAFKFIFVIHGHQPDWLPPIMQAMKKRMSVYKKIWKCDVVVWNDELAKQAGYIK